MFKMKVYLGSFGRKFLQLNRYCKIKNLQNVSCCFQPGSIMFSFLAMRESEAGLTIRISLNTRGRMRSSSGAP